MGRVSQVAFWGKKDKEKPESRESKKKPGLFRRLWQKFRNIDWKDPVTRWKALFVALIGSIVIFGGGYGVLSFTNSPTFCANCHEMAPEVSTFTASAHSEITCVQCHIKPGFMNMITHKVISLKEVYHHVMGIPEQIVQTEHEAVSDENCLQCHSKNRLVSASGDLIVNHKGHIEEGVPCISCHAGVAHAKIAARGINTEEVRGHWTKEVAQQMMEKKYLAPNMGTCIDCHDKVNNGEKPWKDVAYLVPPNPEHLKEEATKEKSNAVIHEANTEEEAKEAAAQHDEKTQKIILEALGKQQKDVKISMACATCHEQVNIPEDHKAADWNQNHGGTALNQLDKCVDCHQDSKWFRDIPKEDLVSLLKMAEVEEEQKDHKYQPNITVVREQSRINKFCSACHSERPTSHGESDQWLTSHSGKAGTQEEKAQCLVCHDREKPTAESPDVKAPTDVYCQYCHRTGFKDDVKN
ncbi:nitrate/TMAO reductase-like tetraheme cytochrome c subunit [Neobacillus niacini]|nr:nitrate/TMAO reductase-like tetraheme cytochrome c subunit [Neobacillus niacini]